MKRLIALVMATWALVMLAGCGSGISAGDIENNIDVTETGDSNNVLVVYFSRAGENYGVGVVEKGNTAVVADMIIDQMNADEFEIIPESSYPEGYEDMLAIAEKEKSEKALPEYQGDVENWKDYDTVFIGYPIWYGDMPRIVYTFLENHDWTGKTVIPFDTNGGSGLAQTESTIAKETDAVVLDGLAVSGTDAQENQDSVKDDVQSWLESLGL